MTTLNELLLIDLNTIETGFNPNGKQVDLCCAKRRAAAWPTLILKQELGLINIEHLRDAQKKTIAYLVIDAQLQDKVLTTEMINDITNYIDGESDKVIQDTVSGMGRIMARIAHNPTFGKKDILTLAKKLEIVEILDKEFGGKYI